MPHRTPCTQSAHDRARKWMPHRIPCTESADDRARRLQTHRTPCTQSADDRAHRLQTHRTPCIDGADDRAGRFLTRRTPCTESTDDRAHRLQTHRTPCTETAHDRADKRCTPCTSSDSSPVLARPLCRRGSLPLRALRRQLIPILVNIGTVDIRNRYPHLRTPHRRHSSHAPHGVERPLAKKLGTRLSNRGSKYFI